MAVSFTDFRGILKTEDDLVRIRQCPVCLYLIDERDAVWERQPLSLGDPGKIARCRFCERDALPPPDPSWQMETTRLNRLRVVGPIAEFKRCMDWCETAGYVVRQRGPYTDQEMFPRADNDRFLIIAERTGR